MRIAAPTPVEARVARGVCHRAKNNFQTIANILVLGSAHCRTPSELMESVEGRLLAVSLFYILVDESGGQPPLLSRLAEEVLRRSLWHAPPHLRLVRDLPAIPLSLGLYSPLSLWLHEVISNALRHGLEMVSGPVLEVRDGLDDEGLWLSMSDNGPGLSLGFSIGHDSRLGFRLIQAMASENMLGALDVGDAGLGLRATMRIPSAKYQRLSEEIWW